MALTISSLPPGLSLRCLGYDAMVINGACESLSWISVGSDGAERIDASAYTMMSSYSFEENARKNVSDSFLSIGPAAERGIIFSTLQSGGREIGGEGLGYLFAKKGIKGISFPSFPRKDFLGNGKAERKARRRLERSRWSKTMRREGGGRFIDAYLRLGAMPVECYSRRFDPRVYFLDGKAFNEKYGVYPECVIDYLALMGDKVDNVPGINKCGPKTAAKWIAEYGSLDNLVANADRVKGKIGEYLREGIPFLDLAKKLVTINTQAPVSFDPIEFAKKEPDAQGLAQFYARWEMSGSAGRRAIRTPKKTVPTMTPDLFAAPSIPTEETSESTPAVSPVVAGDVRVVCSPDEVAQLADELNAVATDRFPVAIWVAGNNTSPMHDAAVGLAFALNPLRTAYVPLMHQDGPNANAEAVREHLAPWFASAAAKVFFDAKRCQHLLANAGLPVSGTVHDAMLMSYVIEAHLKHNFAKIVARTTGLSALDDEGLFGKGAGKLDAVTVPLKDAAAFGVRTAALLRTAASVMWVKLSEDEALLSIYRDMELPVMQVLTGMERSGVLIDREKLAQQSKELAERIDEVKAKIEEIAGGAFNPASPKQLAQVLFEKLQLPVKKKTASGTPSTDEEVLSELALDYPLPKLILEFRALSKLKSTYTDKLPQMADPEDGRVHTTFGQATAVTGRLASSDPNLQNIPVRTAEGRRVREAFIAKPGCKLISADYSQIELRIMAHISQDEGLLKAFREGKDIHRATAAEVFGTQPENVTAEQRRMAKVINFGLIYGMSAFGLAQNLGIERRMASHYIEEYFARYPGVARYMQQTRSAAHAQGYVQTAFGRRLWFAERAR